MIPSVSKKNNFWTFFSFTSLLLLFLLFFIIFLEYEFRVSAQSTCKSDTNNHPKIKKRNLLIFFFNFFYLTDLSTIAGENAYSFVGSPMGNLDLWGQITDIQINPNGAQIIFSDYYAYKIRKIDFSTGLFSS